MAELKVRVIGLKELEAIMKNPNLIRKPARDFMERATITVENRAKETAPVDTGRYKASITHSVSDFKGVVGSNVKYAPTIEFGQKVGIWPDRTSLQGWVRRHGMGQDAVFTIAQNIFRRGLRAKKIFRKALNDSDGDIKKHLQRFGQDILAQFRQ